MTQEDNKELLLKDLCARLPYGVKVAIEDDYLYSGKIITGMTKSGLIYINPFSYKLDQVKPYLFPMSSMTEEQKKELVKATGMIDVFDYLNSHHFDFRNLIDRKLAIDATNLNIY